MKPNNITKICEHCQSEFTRPKHLAENMRFCSKKCYYDSCHIYVKCGHCETIFRGKSSSKFCSTSCRNKYYAKPLSDSHKEKLSISMKGKNAGDKNHSYGKFGSESKSFGSKRTDESKLKMSLKRKGLYIKDKNPNWKGGISYEGYSPDWTKELKTQVRKRDKFICNICGKHGHIVHHIDYNKNNCNIENLITLCKSCHPKTNYKRDEWIVYFSKIDNININNQIK